LDRLLCGITVVVLVVISGSAAAVERPSEPGPYSVGYYEDIMDVETYTDWTKVDPNLYSGSKPPGTQFQMPVRIYYPALGTGEGAEPDGSGGPYVFIIFDQDWGEITPNTSAYREEIEFLASHGMVVLTLGERMGPPVGNPVEGIDHVRCIVLQMENLTLNSSSVLHGMVNASAMGTVGHHWGGVYNLRGC